MPSVSKTIQSFQVKEKKYETLPTTSKMLASTMRIISQTSSIGMQDRKSAGAGARKRGNGASAKEEPDDVTSKLVGADITGASSVRKEEQETLIDVGGGDEEDLVKQALDK